MKDCIKLSAAEMGQKYKITFIDENTENILRLKALGFTCGSVVIPVHTAPFGKGTKAYYIKGSVMALRNNNADGIKVIEIEAKNERIDSHG